MRLYLVLWLLMFVKVVAAQQTRVLNDPDLKFREAQGFFQQEQYGLAYPLLQELRASITETQRVNEPVTCQEILYYHTVCALLLNEPVAESSAQQYIMTEQNESRVQRLRYQLGNYYFRATRFADAARAYEQAGIANLSNDEIATLRFRQGYCYFTQQRFEEARPLFNSVRSLKGDPYFLDAHYYYGFLQFRDRRYAEALECFRAVENEPAYAGVVPYYIAQIQYIQGRKEEAITYIQEKLRSGSSDQYYAAELRQLIGHAFFERREYARALPYLEAYVSQSKKVRREDLYELSYCYYMEKQLGRAIEGFRQLSGKDDSLSQHAMYLLGDAYLKTGQKSNARNAFLFCSTNSSNPVQKEIARFQYAKLSYELGFQDEAIARLSAFLNDHPDSDYAAEGRELMVDLLARTNNFREALRLLETVDRPTEQTRKVYPRMLLGRASELINDGQLSEAEGLLDRLLKDPYARPVLPYAFFWKGEVAYRNNLLDTAIRYFHAYLDAGAPAAGEANAIHARYNLGYGYLRKENYRVALGFFEPLLKTPVLNSDPLAQDIHIRTADGHFMLKNYDKARSMYDQVIRLSWPGEDYATFQVAMLAGVRSAADKITGMNTLVRKFPGSPLVTDAQLEVANTYMGNEKFREAIPYLEKVIEAGRNRAVVATALLKLGTAFYNTDNNPAALKQFRLLVTGYPNAPETGDALDYIRTIYIEDGKPDAYAAFMREIDRPLTISTEDSLTYQAAEKLFDAQKVMEALAAFGAYLERFPRGAHALDAHYRMAVLCLQKKDWSRALPSLEAVLAEVPNRYAEPAALAAARTTFFEIKDPVRAEGFYVQLKQFSTTQENRLEAMRGLLRCQYRQQKWKEAQENARELSEIKGSSTDDRSLAQMAIARSLESDGQFDQAIPYFRTVIQLNRSALAAEARYAIAQCWFRLNKLSDSEKAAFETINRSGSYDHWITRAYLLLGDIYLRQKDYFNAKATFQSVAANASEPPLQEEARTKLERVNVEEAAAGKLNQ